MLGNHSRLTHVVSSDVWGGPADRECPNDCQDLPLFPDALDRLPDAINRNCDDRFEPFQAGRSDSRARDRLAGLFDRRISH